MKNIKKLLSIMVVALLVVTAIPIQAEAAVKISKTKQTLYVGQSITLKVTGTKKKVKWSSTNKKVATVTQKGKIKAKQAGVATIKATVTKKVLKCKITVKKKEQNTPTGTPKPSSTLKPEETPSQSQTPSPAPEITPTPEPTPTSEPQENLKEKVEILAEYTLPDSIGWFTRHFIIVKNNSKTTVDISTSSIAYAKDGSMVSVADSSFEALGAGCTSVFYEAFETSAEIDHYSTEMNVTSSEYYNSVIQDLSYTQNNIEDGVIFQVKNDGKSPAEFVEGYALFFLNGKLVEYDTAYFTDDDSELKPGATITKQFNAYEKFDKVEFYLTGRRYVY